MYWDKILTSFDMLRKETVKRGKIMRRVAESTNDVNEYWYNRGLADAHKWDAEKMHLLVDSYKLC